MEDKLLMLGYKLTKVNNVEVYRNEDTQKLAIVVGNKQPLIKSYAGNEVDMYRNEYQVRLKTLINTTGNEELRLNIIIDNKNNIYDLRDGEDIGETDTLIIMYSNNLVRLFNKKTGAKNIIKVGSYKAYKPFMKYGIIELPHGKILLQNMYLDFKNSISFYVSRVHSLENCVLLGNERLRIYRNGKECDLTTKVQDGIYIKGRRYTFLIDRTDGNIYSLMEYTAIGYNIEVKMQNIMTKHFETRQYSTKEDEHSTGNFKYVKFN